MFKGNPYGINARQQNLRLLKENPNHKVEPNTFKLIKSNEERDKY